MVMTVPESPAPPSARSPVQRGALWATVAGTVGIALAYTTAFLPPAIARWGPYLMAVALPLCLMATMVLGAARPGQSLGRLRWPLGVVLLLVGGGFLLALALPPDAANGGLWLGLPPRAAVIVYGVGLLPLFVLPLAYAVTFDRMTLSEEAIARVRAARRVPMDEPLTTHEAPTNGA